MYIYGSYRIIKTGLGLSLFGPPCRPSDVRISHCSACFEPSCTNMNWTAGPVHKASRLIKSCQSCVGQIISREWVSERGTSDLLFLRQVAVGNLSRRCMQYSVITINRVGYTFFSSYTGCLFLISAGRCTRVISGCNVRQCLQLHDIYAAFRAHELYFCH